LSQCYPILLLAPDAIADELSRLNCLFFLSDGILSGEVNDFSGSGSIKRCSSPGLPLAG
jgi:hypothetical protein